MGDGDLPGLTQQQRRCLDYLRQYQAINQRPPSVREIGTKLGLSSTSSVTHLLRTLESKGRIRREYRSARSIRILDNGTGGPQHHDRP